MKLTLVLRDKKNALKLSTKSIEHFIERITTDTKDGVVARRRRQLSYGGYMDGYDRQYPSHLIYPSAVFEKDDNDNLRMKAFNGVVALTIDGLKEEEVEVVKRAAQILHYTLAAFIGPSGREVIILVRIVREYSGISPEYSEISTENSEISTEYSEISKGCSKIRQPYSEISDTYLTEEEADVLCQEGHRLAAALYQSIIPKPIKTEPVSVKSNFHMPLDESPYFNPKAVALPVSGKPITISHTAVIADHGSPHDPEVSRKTQQLLDFLTAHYQFRYNNVMGYTEYIDNSRRYMDWIPVDDRALKGMTMKVRLGGIDICSFRR